MSRFKNKLHEEIYDEAEVIFESLSIDRETPQIEKIIEAVKAKCIEAVTKEFKFSVSERQKPNGAWLKAIKAIQGV